MTEGSGKRGIQSFQLSSEARNRELLLSTVRRDVKGKLLLNANEPSYTNRYLLCLVLSFLKLCLGHLQIKKGRKSCFTTSQLLISLEKLSRSLTLRCMPLIPALGDRRISVNLRPVWAYSEFQAGQGHTVGSKKKMKNNKLKR